MPSLFTKETAQTASRPQVTRKLQEIDGHELLRASADAPAATFDEVREIGAWFMTQSFDKVLPSSQPLPLELLRQHYLAGNQPFLAKLALGAESEAQFPATIQVIKSNAGWDLKLHVVPIHFGALEQSRFTATTDGLLALAAAAATAPQFILDLETGLTGECSTEDADQEAGHHPAATRSSFDLDHGTPLAAIFESFHAQNEVMHATQTITRNPLVTLKQAAHLHELPISQSDRVSRGAGLSRVAAGVPIRSLLRSQLPKHTLFVQTRQDDHGQLQFVSLQESLMAANPDSHLGFIAVALGMSASVIGDDQREQKMERILSATSGDVPLMELVR